MRFQGFRGIGGRGETPSRHIHVRGLAQALLLADLPLCGGDARQGRGGMSPHPPFTKQHTFRASLTAPRR
ncbi:hypothetical protein DA102_018595 [Sinorhizobium meliloti]|nr:hypothetical protein DA102_018595 [Sinorhizobium meliloti]